MKRLFIFFFCCLQVLFAAAQLAPIDSSAASVFDFVSDTQQPMGVEKIYLKPTQNIRATGMIYDAVLRDKPSALFMLGDIVALGYSNKKWRSTDKFLDSARKEGIKVYGLLGNHDVMLRDKRGEKNFNRRFPEHRRTGYLQVIDSMAMLLLNSNFSKLSAGEIDQQQQWYTKMIDSLNNSPAIKGIIVACHHPIFTNSDMVKPSASVRQQFLPAFLAARKCVLYITGHAHAFEHFRYQKKDFLVVGGGGGLHQPLTTKAAMPVDLALSYKPFFHYMQVKRFGNFLQLRSFRLNEDFSGFTAGYQFVINL